MPTENPQQCRSFALPAHQWTWDQCWSHKNYSEKLVDITLLDLGKDRSLPSCRHRDMGRDLPWELLGSYGDQGGLWEEGEVAGNEMVSHRNQRVQGSPSCVLGFSARNRGKEWNRCTFTQPDPWAVHQSFSYKHGERASKQSCRNGWPQVIYLPSGKAAVCLNFPPDATLRAAAG